MADEQRPPGKPDESKARRFRIARKVKTETEIPETYAQQAIREAQTDDADHGSPEMDRAVSKGCMGCLRVTLLFFLIMAASIITTWCIRRRGV